MFSQVSVCQSFYPRERNVPNVTITMMYWDVGLNPPPRETRHGTYHSYPRDTRHDTYLPLLLDTRHGTPKHVWLTSGQYASYWNAFLFWIKRALFYVKQRTSRRECSVRCQCPQILKLISAVNELPQKLNGCFVSYFYYEWKCRVISVNERRIHLSPIDVSFHLIAGRFLQRCKSSAVRIACHADRFLITS